MTKYCIGEGYERMGHKIIIAKKKPYGSILKKSNKYVRHYVRGRDNIFIAKKGVKLSKC